MDNAASVRHFVLVSIFGVVVIIDRVNEPEIERENIRHSRQVLVVAELNFICIFRVVFNWILLQVIFGFQNDRIRLKVKIPIGQIKKKRTCFPV